MLCGNSNRHCMNLEQELELHKNTFILLTMQQNRACGVTRISPTWLASAERERETCPVGFATKRGMISLNLAFVSRYKSNHQSSKAIKSVWRSTVLYSTCWRLKEFITCREAKDQNNPSKFLMVKWNMGQYFFFFFKSQELIRISTVCPWLMMDPVITVLIYL